ncbi:hypothetical protein HMPREF2738_03607 [Clostridiales bacterium KLE1615]|nr:hypothetical protein HMPREF2738_03607 [Clostridiales bacterium KLE1615]
MEMRKIRSIRYAQRLIVLRKELFFIMMYPFMTLNDNTEIVHSEMKPDGLLR